MKLKDLFRLIDEDNEIRLVDCDKIRTIYRGVLRDITYTQYTKYENYNIYAINSLDVILNIELKKSKEK